MGEGPGVPVTPLCETFYFFNEQHTIFRLRKSADLKNFHYFGPKNHGWITKFAEICFVSKYSPHDNVASIRGVTHCDPSSPLKNPGYAPVAV